MPKYRIYAVVTATKYMGEFEAESKEAAEDMAWESDAAHISVCHQCSREVDGAEISRLEVEETEQESEC